MRSMVIVLGLLAAGLGAGCREGQSMPPAPPAAAPATNPPALHLNHAQPALQTVKAWVGTNELVTEVAATTQQLATGMMFRTQMPENSAMIFVFGQPLQASFYMRNTVIPLSAAYIDPEGVILELHDLQPKDETPVAAATDQVQYVLEVNQGWFARHNVTTGMVVRTQFGMLRETFFRSR